MSILLFICIFRRTYPDFLVLSLALALALALVLLVRVTRSDTVSKLLLLATNFQTQFFALFF